ncbi:MAG: tryptophan synthase subunit alpha [Candidatus Omnitrophica bacterium]|nr:tryptophan synthase subunit alpha [Candidatus Omnitrophota bacterium]
MNKIDKTFKKLKTAKKKAFIPYVVAGDPDIKTTEKIVLALAESGADIIELGIPFSDPLADGATIQRAVMRALSHSVSVEKVFDMVRRLRKSTDVPFVFMTYYNIILNYGVARFVKNAKSVGADGVIVADLPMEETKKLKLCADRSGFDVIMLAAPTTPIERFKMISNCSRGFVYYVSLTGVTGARESLPAKLKNEIKKLKKHTKKPICVGFGISSAHQAKNIARVADGVIVGSAIIKRIEKNLKNKTKMVREVESFARSIAGAIHSVG